jgi:hypothetical protein
MSGRDKRLVSTPKRTDLLRFPPFLFNGKKGALFRDIKVYGIKLTSHTF